MARNRKRPTSRRSESHEGSAPSIGSYDYETTKAEIANAEARLVALRAHKDALEVAYARGAHADGPLEAFLSDEGVKIARISGSRIVNLTDVPDARRPTLSVGGNLYQHVSESPEGKWIYRHDR